MQNQSFGTFHTIMGRSGLKDDEDGRPIANLPFADADAPSFHSDTHAASLRSMGKVRLFRAATERHSTVTLSVAGLDKSPLPVNSSMICRRR
jgi:hypothetical protein